jgi:hypothetical protein
MVTHGFCVFRYKGIYYSFYNHSDSYLSGLGEEIVSCLRKMTEKDFIEMCHLLETMPEPEDDGSKKEGFWDVMDVLRSPECVEYYITDSQCHEAEYTYTIDLDNKQFVAKTFLLDQVVSYKFGLFNIPDDWVEQFEQYL